MPMPPESGSADPSAAVMQARLIGDALALGRGLDLWSLALTIVALAILVWGDLPYLGRALCVLAVIAGAGQKVYAMRVAFDRQLFSAWARRWQGARCPAPDADMARLDEALADWGLRACGTGPPRPLAARARGARRLLRRQAWLLALQLACCTIAALISR